MYKNFEARFKVVLPDNDNATYSSLMNYSDDLEKPIQRWYRYKEGYSVDLISKLISQYLKNDKGIILDPFLGSGTTMIVANQLGLPGIGFEVNPFSHFLARCKLSNYSESVSEEFYRCYTYMLQRACFEILDYNLPKLSIADKVFNQDVEEYLLTLKMLISEHTYIHKDTQDLLLLGWLSALEQLSNYRKAGNGLKKRKYKKPRIVDKRKAFDTLEEIYGNMSSDIIENDINFDVELHNTSSLLMGDTISRESISGIIFSPPYANCFDYTEIYKIELWFGEFVKEYKDLKKLRNQSLRSHLNGNIDYDLIPISTEFLNILLEELSSKKLWDKKIPRMIQLYFNDMFKIIRDSYDALEQKGFCCIVVGNSSYGGVVFPTDLILADYAESIGFIVDKIEVDRYLITSSQQYHLTKNDKGYLRESVVCLVKP